MTNAHLTLAAVEAALLAGEFLRKNFLSPHVIEKKEGKQNLVTECDLQAEQLILSCLYKKFPEYGFLSEERGEKNAFSKILWVIDPLDGTLNFARGIPHFSVSIAAVEEGIPIVGVVYSPITQELFVAEKGQGASCNGTPLSVSSIHSLDEAFLASGFPYNIHENPMHCIEKFSSFLHQGNPLRRLGSAALDLAYVAAGRFDAYFETGIKPWDVAAGILLLQESGGALSRWDGSLYRLYENCDILASNKLLHLPMLQMLQSKGSP